MRAHEACNDGLAQRGVGFRKRQRIRGEGAGIVTEAGLRGEAGENEFHPDVERLKLQRKGFGKGVHRRLAGRVDREQRQRAQRNRRGHIDDGAGLARPELRQNGLDHRHGTEGIGFEDASDHVDRRAFERVQPADAGIAHEHVDIPSRGDGLRDAALVCHIQLQQLQIGGRGNNAVIRGAHGGDDAPAAFEEVFRGLQAKARGAAGDEYGFHYDSCDEEE